jgi:diguanylate cyclase (GGDEF)-like protein
MRERTQKFVAGLRSRLTVRQQIGLAAAVLCIAVVAAMAAATAWFGAQQASTLIRRDLASTAEALARQLNRTLLDRYREVRIFAGLRPLQPLWQNDPAALRTALEQLQESYADYSWIGFAAPDGIVLASTQGLLEGASVGKRPWFTKGLEGPTLEDVHEAQLLAKLLGPRPSGEPFRFVDIAFPVRSETGNLLGVLGAHLSWDFATALRESLLKGVDPGTGLELVILARDGTPLLGRAAGSPPPYTAEQHEDMRQRKSGTFVDDSTRRLTAFAVVDSGADYPGLGWLVVASQPAAVALAPVHRLVQIIALLGLAAAALGIGLAMIIAGRIAKPLQMLAKEADHLGRETSTLMLSRHTGSVEVERLSTALRSLLRRVGLAELRTHEAELRATEGAEQYAHDVSLLRRMAETDPLTNLLNRRAFLSVATDAFEYFRRYERPIAMLVIDIDHFKRVNDSYGHRSGDVVIKRVGELIEENLRSTDKAARFGGEEFVVLLREVDAIGAQALAKRLCKSIAEDVIEVGKAHIAITASIGVSLAEEKDRDVQDTIERADRGLYMAKNTGRDRVFFIHSGGAASAKAA